MFVLLHLVEIRDIHCITENTQQQRINYSAESFKINFIFHSSITMGGVWSNTEAVKSSASTSQPDISITSDPQAPDQTMSHHHSAARPSLCQQRDQRSYQSVDALNETQTNKEPCHQHSRAYWSRKGPQHTQRS